MEQSYILIGTSTQHSVLQALCPESPTEKQHASIEVEAELAYRLFDGPTRASTAVLASGNSTYFAQN